MKKTTRVIEFDSKQRILEKAQNYVESVDLFIDERDQAIPLLLKPSSTPTGNLKEKYYSCSAPSPMNNASGRCMKS